MSDFAARQEAVRLIAEGRIGKAVDALIDGASTKRTAIIDAFSVMLELTDNQAVSVSEWVLARQARRKA